MLCFLIALIVTVLAGCAGQPFVDHLAGSPLPTAPHFNYRELFLEGEDLRVAVDPNQYPDKVGSIYHIYVVEHKSASQWTKDQSLSDVTGSVRSATLTAGSIRDNVSMVWADMILPSTVHTWHKQYDVVFDFNGNGQYDEDEDIIDRVGVLERPGAEESGGFTLTRDPMSNGDFPVSTHFYDLGKYSVTVPPEYEESGDPKEVNLIGKLYYPATYAGEDKLISTDFSEYPMIIIAHGCHYAKEYNYLGYDYLGNQLASRGFICASITLHELAIGWRIHHRGMTILKHLDALLIEPTTDTTATSIRSKVNFNMIGLLGHSRGGEGVVAAQNIQTEFKCAYDIKAILALAPTDGDNFDSYSPQIGPYDPVAPYMMIYGTEDHELRGSGGNSGFRTYDRAVRPRHYLAIYGGNHNFFNDKWDHADGSPTITRVEQKEITTVYVTAFFSNYLLDQQAYVEFLAGYTVSPSISAINTTVLHSDQPKRWIHLTVDDSQDVPAGVDTNSLGFTNTSSGVTTFTEESLRIIASPEVNYYIHDTDGLRVEWGEDGGSVTFNVGNQNFHPFAYLNFRVGQRFRMTDNVNPPDQPQDFSVTLVDIAGNSSPAYPVSVYIPIYYTYVVEHIYYNYVVDHTKSIMQTVRIPMRAFTANGSPLNLGHIRSIRFTFDQVNTGELIFDDIELLGLDVTEPVIP